MRKRVWIHIGDLVLASLRGHKGHEFQDNIADILHKYTNDEMKTIIKNENLVMFDTNNNNKDNLIVFDDDYTHDDDDDDNDDDDEKFINIV